MKKIGLFLMFVFVSLFAEARELININNGWSFSVNSSFLSDKTVVNLPHTWNSDVNRGMNNFYFGTGNYLKELIIPREWSDNKRVYIKFNGVTSVATLFINGRYVDTHKGAFTAFTFEISQFLNFGSYNSILVVANNSSNMDVMPLNVEKTIFGGVNRDVELIVTENNHISLSDYGSDGVYVKQLRVSKESADVEVKVKIDGRIGSNLGVKVNVKDGAQYVAESEASTTIETNGKTEVTIPFTITSPRLWNGVFDPFMYDVNVTLTENGKEVDVMTVPLGLRFFSVDRDRGFMLNGEPYKLNGVIYRAERAGVGSAMTKLNREEDVDMMVDMGVTAVRMAGSPHDRYVYELCDREGLIVWSDLPFTSDMIYGGKGFLDSYDFRSNGEDQLTEMIRQNYNSPSLIFLGLFDKISSKGDDCKPYVEMLNDIAHNEASDRLTVGTSIEDGEINKITDVISWAQYFGWSAGMPADFDRWIDQFKTKWIDIKPAVGEYGAGANILHQSDVLEKPADKDSMHPENWQSYVHEQHISMLDNKDFVWGAFANCMFDYTDGVSGVNDFGLVSQDRHIKKDAFYAYKANWNTTDPFVHIAERRNMKRASLTQNVKVYTNLVEIELLVNGVSVGTKQASHGIVEWKGLNFNVGVNSVEARSGRIVDQYNVEVIKSM